jgi:GntR family transcriptional repressor for pyruvate dehydrogenase complex
MPKAADALADRLRDEILSGRLAEGDVLPVERDMALRSNLSRGSVREALLTLTKEGLVSVRPGRAGGAFVRRPDTSAVEHSLRILIEGGRAPFGALLEVREALEPAAAELAASRRTDEDLVAIDGASSRLMQSLDDATDFLQCNVQWHLAVAGASHNELLVALMGALSAAIYRGTDIREFHSDGVRRATIRAHDRVVELVRAGDASGARRAMQQHVHAYRTAVEERDVAGDVDLDSGAGDG